MEYDLKYTDWGIGYAYNNTIEINKKLLKYPELYEMVLEHEIKHLKYPSFFDTIKIEIKDLFDFKKRILMKKYLKNESMMTIQSMLPVWKHNNQWCYNSYLVSLYSVFIGVIIMDILIFI